MSKIEASKFELSFVEFHFEKMLRNVANIAGFHMDEKHQKFTVFIDSAIPQMLVGDDQRLAQVVTNLLSNAVKFTPEDGSITLDVRLIEETDGTCTIKFAVRDTGIGVSPEQKSLLFNSFQQAESGTTRKYGGTGLGLAISKHIITMMGGHIWVESELGKGSTFAFTVRLQRGTCASPEAFASGIDWSNGSALAVDDDPAVLLFLKEVINRCGVACDTALNAEDALALVDKNQHYNIFFLDWQLPGMDGIALAKMIRFKKPEVGDTVIIMISAANLSEIKKHGEIAEIDKYLPKPLFSSDIFNTLTEVLGVEQQTTDDEPPDDIAGCLAGRNILLAEDVYINREIVETLLEPTLVTIDCAENGEEAVRMFSEAPEKYDVIFMDVQMPIMDGCEATRRIREFHTPRAQSVPIIAMTANVFKDDIEKCRLAGMNDHLGKPLNFDDVLEKLKNYMSL
jgi:CheY-like chemotaxis protein